MLFKNQIEPKNNELPSLTFIQMYLHSDINESHNFIDFEFV